jgi:Protein of unknown function (DUF3800)
MILTVHIDESGTHADSPISVMAGYVDNATRWKHFEADWAVLVAKAGVRHIHTVDLLKHTKQFKGWKPEEVNALVTSLDNVIARHLQLGFSVIVRDDDYRNIYGAGPHPRRPQKDSKYGVLFRACLVFVPGVIASELKLVGQTAMAEPTTINFALEGGPKNGDARRLFDLYKKDTLPEWRHLVGTFKTSTKDSDGAQAADFLAYTIYRAEILEHGQAASVIERSSYVADTPLIANTYPRQPLPPRGPAIFRIPITRDMLQSLKDDLFAIEAERRADYAVRRSRSATGNAS